MKGQWRNGEKLKWGEMVSPGHEGTALTNSGQLWLPAQDQASLHSNKDGGRAQKAPPLALAEVGYWAEILRGVVHSRLPMLK